ncbi:uncharacterized protein BDR25DRAFT_266994 [Lindgomyces ingoldianus]|uniref:Uncharacterized protein n=1 Tax=Lindgomyces ingoldianus TaxID=673940 RepID=A0ACB6QKV8_9PLEO|nr:uncharacterized protein BDR25DRAFT_266994 [Lindgomyces ingoldianus]KAF2467535.1 hypothetical protein BDR25DRAFT_266994 [Lindgomyces ingoldianus]
MTEVLSVQLADGAPFSHAPLRRSSASHTSFFDSATFGSSRKNNYSHSDLRSDSLSSSQTSFQSTPASSLSLDTRFEDDDEDDDALAFPAYSGGHCVDLEETSDPPSSPVNANSRPPPSPIDGVVSPTTSTPDPLLISEDDTAVRVEPSQHVDYLSYEWKEEDIWSSWRHIVTQRKVYGERSRLENASWRTWAKSQFKLQTVSPETLNWLKDCDVTWLYGPLQPASNRFLSQHQSEPISRLSKNNSFLNKKPILKKRSVSEVMLQKSLSASSLVKQAAAAVQAQQANGATLERRRQRPIIGCAPSDFVTSTLPSQTVSRDPIDSFSSRSTSGLHTPDHAERRHIRFDDKVEQCIAVDIKDGEYDDDEDANDSWAMNDDDDSSDDGVVMMKKSRKKRPLSRTNSRSSFTGESKTIAKLPSTTLKYRTDSPDVTEQQPTHSLGFWRSSRLSPSPSQETLRPSNPSTNFLLPEEDDEEDVSWEPSGAYEVKRASTPSPSDFSSTLSNSFPEYSSESGGLRRTASGMFMPYDEVDDDPVPPGIIGRVVDTVNTARDIAHVIWNVGWRN